VELSIGILAASDFFPALRRLSGRRSCQVRKTATIFTRNRAECADFRYGERLALLAVTMARKIRDARPGPLPEIQSAGGSVTFRFEVVGVRNTPNLVLRCDADGSVWAAIAPPKERPASHG
jgi:hypothetical protein